jgi:hypothetical protein
MPGGHHFNPPKIVFSNVDGSKTLGRVSCTQMKASGMAAIDLTITSIQNDPTMQAVLNGQPAASSP